MEERGRIGVAGGGGGGGGGGGVISLRRTRKVLFYYISHLTLVVRHENKHETGSHNSD